MLLTITTTHAPATDLGFLLMKPHGLYGKYPLGSKHGPGVFEFRTL